MPSLKSLKIRIASVKSTQKITKAMQLISASRLYRAREALFASIPYYNGMQSIMSAVIHKYARNAGWLGPMVQNNGGDKYLVIVATSDRGLCGGFNASIVRQARTFLSEFIANNKKIHVIFLGKKGHELLRTFCPFESCKVFNNPKEVSFCDALRIAAKILAAFQDEQFNVCKMIYSEFISTIKQRVMHEQLIPVCSDSFDIDSGDIVHSYEPSIEELHEQIIPRYIAIQIYHVLLENAASEHSARMVAMDGATRNSTKMIQRLKNVYNRTRQASITRELTEIIAGAQAV